MVKAHLSYEARLLCQRMKMPSDHPKAVETNMLSRLDRRRRIFHRLQAGYDRGLDRASLSASKARCSRRLNEKQPGAVMFEVDVDCLQEHHQGEAW